MNSVFGDDEEAHSEEEKQPNEEDHFAEIEEVKSPEPLPDIMEPILEIVKEVSVHLDKSQEKLEMITQ